MTRKLVVDASIALAWSLQDGPAHLSHEALLHAHKYGAFVPTLWLYEISNVLTLLVRRKRIDRNRAITIGEALDALKITSVSPDGEAWRRATTDLAERFSLTIYDASYLQLAIASGAALATADKALENAAERSGVLYTV
jgi:predicted nucleic acid-binding protein